MQPSYKHVLHDVKVQKISLYPNCKFESERGEMKEADTFEVDSFSNSVLVIPKYLYRLQSLDIFSSSIQSI